MLQVRVVPSAVYSPMLTPDDNDNDDDDDMADDGFGSLELAPHKASGGVGVVVMGGTVVPRVPFASVAMSVPYLVCVIYNCFGFFYSFYFLPNEIT